MVIVLMVMEEYSNYIMHKTKLAIYFVWVLSEIIFYIDRMVLKRVNNGFLQEECYRPSLIPSVNYNFRFSIFFTLKVPAKICSTCVFQRDSMHMQGAQWLSGRVLDSRPRGRGFEPHGRLCVVVLEQDTFILA